MAAVLQLEPRFDDPVARDLASSRPQLLFDARDEVVDGRIVQPPRGRPLDPRSQLARVERLRRPGALADEQRRLLDPLVGREATTARQALAAPADGSRLLGQARVDDLVVIRPTGGTAHENTVIRPPG